MRYRRMVMEVESPEQIGYDRVRYNLAESSLSDRTLGELGVDLSGLVLRYGDHRGHPGLRELIAADGAGVLAPDDVLLTVGAAGALFTVATTLLGPGDHVVVVRPNYASNVETPRAIGAEIAHLDLRFDEGWRLDPERLAAMLRPETKLVSLTSPHNPTGAVIDAETMDAVIAAVERTDAYLLLDETYRELAAEILPPWAAVSPRVITVSSLSKTYGVPGIRLGWLICHDRALMERLLAGKEQIALGGSVVDEEIGYQLLARRVALLPAARAHAAQGLVAVRGWMPSEPLLEWVEPAAGVVGFPRIVADAGVDPAAFHRVLNAEHATFVGPGHWFEQDPRHFRIGFGYPTPDDLATGLANISGALRAAGH